MTDQEAAAFYATTLSSLRERGAIELVQDIESTVVRGRPRMEAGGKTGTLQTPLSPREALVVALHMLVAAVEPPLQLEAAQELLGADVKWGFDELAPREVSGESGTVWFPVRASSALESPQVPRLSQNARETLRTSATRLLMLVRELEEHVDADAS